MTPGQLIDARSSEEREAMRATNYINGEEGKPWGSGDVPPTRPEGER